MHKTTYLFICLALINFSVTSQNTENNASNKDNFRFGGGFNIGLGNSYSTFSISPSVIYDFSEEFGAGLGLTYVYVKSKSTVSSTTNLFGGSILTFYKPIHYIQLSTEFEQLKINQKYSFYDDISQWQSALYFGLEYVSGNVALGLRYDVLYDKVNNITQSSALTPVFRFYF